MMDMPMNDGMKKEDKKSNYFKCPNCKADLCATDMSKKEDKGFGMKKNASEMPMGELRDKITPPPANPF